MYPVIVVYKTVFLIWVIAVSFRKGPIDHQQLAPVLIRVQATFSDVY